MAAKSKFLNSTRLLACFISAGALQACGGGSGGSSSVPPPPPPPPPPPADTSAPTVSFSPDTLTVESGATGTSTLTATDNVAVTTGPDVTCTNGGSFAGSTFTASTVTAPTTSVCTATASDAAGNSGTGTLTVRMTTPQEAPVALVSSNKSFVPTGQNFVLDASGSTDANNDALTYSWTQISGTAISFSDNTLAVQNLTAPNISSDETLEFEVTVSDGIDSSNASISISIEDLVAVETISNPVTISAGAAPGSSSFEAPIVQISSLSQSSAEDYRVHWYLQGTFGTSETYVASQLYSANGERLETQSDGKFSTFFSPQSPIVVTGRAIQSGSVLYNALSLTRNTGVSEFNYALNTHRGLLDSDVGDYGDEFTRTRNVDESLYSFDSKAIGTDELVTVATFDLASQGRASVLGFTTAAYITQPDGTSVETLISGRERGVEKTDVSAAVFNDHSYVVFWAESDASSDDFDLKMQRASKAGVLLGEEVIVSENNTNAQRGSQATIMQDGNVFVVWEDYSGTLGDADMGAIKGRIVRPDGTFATSEFIVNSDVVGDQVDPIVKPLSTNQAFVSWSIGSNQGANEIRGMVVNSDGSPDSNEFIIATSPIANNVLSKSAVIMSDDRIILGWYNDGATPDEKTSYTVNFYPLGR